MVESINFDQSERKPKNKKLITAVIFFIIIIALFYLGASEFNKWWQEKKKWIDMGFASDKFPFRMLSEEELVRKGLWSGESEWYNSIPTRTTPEQTYAIFRQALIDGDIEIAVNCFTEAKKVEYRDALIKVKQEGRILEISKQLTDIYPRGERITEGSKGYSNTTYEFFITEYGEKTSHPIGFSKDFNGDWKMENL